MSTPRTRAARPQRPRFTEVGARRSGRSAAGRAPAGDERIDLYWLPLGAGGRSVRLNGRVFEAIQAAREHRPRRALYHAALEVRSGGGRFVIEMTPIPKVAGTDHGVVSEGPVGSRLLGRFRLFRYELRRWRDGVIPDLDEAVSSPVRLSDDPAAVRRLLELVAFVPTSVWGRDELDAGEMWTSNSVVSWLIARSGLSIESVAPPADGRAPGWRAGVVAARRAQRQAQLDFVRASIRACAAGSLSSNQRAGSPQPSSVPATMSNRRRAPTVDA